MRNPGLITLCAAALAACSSLPRPVPVTAVRETIASVSAPRESLGAPSLWTGGSSDLSETGLVKDGFLANTAQPSGLILHDFTGGELQRVRGARLTDIDVSAVPAAESYAVVIGGTEEGRTTRVVLYRLDRGPEQQPLAWGGIDTDLAEPAGFCMRRVMGVLRAVVFDRRGEVRHLQITEGPGGEPVIHETRRYRLSGIGEGCAIDPFSGLVFFTRDRGGFWRTSVSPTADGSPVLLVDRGSPRLPRSREVSYLSQGPDHYLVSLHPDSATFSVWRLADDGLDWIGRVEVRERSGARATRGLTGLEAYFGALGPYPHGVVIVQDQEPDGTARLKFLDWGEVRGALGL